MKDYIVSKYLKDDNGEVYGKVEVDWLKLRLSVIMYNEDDFKILLDNVKLEVDHM